jgi:hypothetical protein
MKHRFPLAFLVGVLTLGGSAPAARAQTNFSVPWFVVVDGGGTTSGGNFTLTGTFGQWEASEQPVNGGAFSLTGGFWSLFSPSTAPFDSLFYDDFIGSTIDPTKWIVSGDTVIQTNGMMEVTNAMTDDGGVLTSVPFAVETNGLITITRGVYLHAQASSQPNYPGTYFMGQFGINIGAVPQFSVYYADFDYADGVTYTNRYGFYLARDGQAPIYIADQSNISAAITPIWDTWFQETVTYDPASGIMQYFTNDVLAMSFDVGALPPTSSPTMMLTFNAWGWWTGDEQVFTNLSVIQAPTASSNAIMVLNGNLAFGGVAPGTTSNMAFTISNAGSAPLNVSGITYPAGFSGAFSGAIPNGTSQRVPVTFSPTAITNYSGAIVVNSDAVGGANTIPVSGYGASGTLELIIDINGEGTVSPKSSGKTLILGKKYTVRAIPKSGNVFVNWSGSTNTAINPLTFAMETSMLLQANFIPSPFLPGKGTYNGLFSTTNGVSEETAGMLKGLVVGAGGTYSGTLLTDGGSHAVSGAFSPSGQATNHISRAAKSGGPLTLEMTLNLAGSPAQITGTVSGTNESIPWMADLVANRAGTNGSAEYTVVLAPTILGLPGVPSGYGYLLLAQHAGILALSGALADGTAVTQTVPLDDTGSVPIYASLYGNTGVVTGWVSITNDLLDGNLDWIKKAAHSGFYTNGFTNALIAQGASWTNVSPAPAIDLTAGQLNLSGGTLANSLSFTVAVSEKNTLTNTAATPTNSLSGTINPKTGLLTVTFGNGAGKAKTVGKGAVLQDTTNAAGFFLDKTNAGSVILEQ